MPTVPEMATSLPTLPALEALPEAGNPGIAAMALPGDTFYRAINLGGEALVIDGNNWEANTGTTLNFTTNGSAICNPWLTLSPSVSGTRVTMLSCWREHWAHNMVMSSVPNGSYRVYLHALQSWNDPSGNQAYTINVEGVSQPYTPGTVEGAWVEVGPFNVTVSDGTLNITTSTGNPILAGLEVWVAGGGGATPTNTLQPPTATPTSIGVTTTSTTMGATATPTPTTPVGGDPLYRAINLGGAAVTIAGENWEANTVTTPNFTTNGSATCNQWLTLSPSAPPGTAPMLTCWREHWAHNMAMSSVPNGSYRVYLYALQSWNDPAGNQAYTIAIEGIAIGSYTPGTVGGVWTKLGPYSVTVNDGTLNLTTSGGNPILAGLEVRIPAGGATATPTPNATATPTPTMTSTPAPGTATPTPSLTPTTGGGTETFYRAINLGGAAVTIAGQNWEANTGTTTNFTTNGTAQCNQWLTLSPSAPPNTAPMLTCWREHWAHNMAMSGMPNGSYRVYLYPLQNWANPAGTTPFSIGLEGVTVASYTPGTAAGVWTKLGPYNVTVSDGTLNLTTGGDAVLAGLEVWRVVAGATATPTVTPTATSTSQPATSTPTLPAPTSTPTPTPTATGSGATTVLYDFRNGNNHISHFSYPGISGTPPPCRWQYTGSSWRYTATGSCNVGIYAEFYLRGDTPIRQIRLNVTNWYADTRISVGLAGGSGTYGPGTFTMTGVANPPYVPQNVYGHGLVLALSAGTENPTGGPYKPYQVDFNWIEVEYASPPPPTLTPTWTPTATRTPTPIPTATPTPTVPICPPAGQAQALGAGVVDGAPEVQAAATEVCQAFTPTPTTPPLPNQRGLDVEYFNDPNWTNRVGVERVTPPNSTEFAYDLGSGAPNPISATTTDNYSVRWRGAIYLPYGGEYRFVTSSDDGMRIIIGATTVVNDVGRVPLQGAIAFPAGNARGNVTVESSGFYPLTIEWQELTLSASIAIQWEAIGFFNQQSLTYEYLYPVGGAVSTPTPTMTATPTPTATPNCPLTPVTLVFGGSDGVDINRPFDPIALGLPEQIPAWLPVATGRVIRYPGSKILQVRDAYTLPVNLADAQILAIGFSAGGDAALMFADDYLATNMGCGRITGVASLGGTMTGTMLDGRNLELARTDVLNDLVLSGIDVYMLDDSAAGGAEASGYSKPVGASGAFVFVSRPTQEHWQGGYPGTGTNNSDAYVAEVIAWFAEN